MPLTKLRLGVTEAVSVDSTTPAATTRSTGNRTLYIASTASVYIKVGKGSPVASAADVLVAPSAPLLIAVTDGEKVSAISQAGSAVVSVTEVDLSS